ncbi:MAG: PAS domain S-box protein [Campylobacterales bacterium]
MKPLLRTAAAVALWFGALLADEAALPYELFERHGAIMMLIEPGSGRIVDANRAAEQFYQMSRERLTEMLISQINILSPKEVAAERQRALKERRNYFIFPHRLADGTIKTVEVHSWPIHMGGRELLFSIIHDISSRQIAEEELHRYKNRLEELVGERTRELTERTEFFNRVMVTALIVQTLVIALLIRNILARRKSEKRLGESEARFRRLAENAQDLIFRYELLPERRFSYVSPASTAMTGFSPEDHYADPELGFKLIHPEDRALLTKVASGEAVKPGKPLLLRWVRKDGRIIWTEQRNTPIFDNQGNLIALEGIARDITELKKAQENAILYEQGRKQALTNLLINLAHQWRQPLNVIGLIAQRMEEELPLQPSAREQLSEWVRNIMAELKALSMTITRFTELHQSKEAPAFAGIDELCKEAQRLLEGRLKSLQIHVRMRIEPQTRLVAARTDWVEIFVKLFENVIAIVHERRLSGTIITVSARPLGEEGIEVIVEDEAGGIDAGVLPFLFEPYSTTAFKSREKGLGLYLIRRILEDRYQGSIQAQNSDRGARFVLQARNFKAS